MRGTIDAGDYKQYIFSLEFFKRICDVYDEEFEHALPESDGDMEYMKFNINKDNWNSYKLGEVVSKKTM